MSAGFAPPWPGSRVLLGWWRELADIQPRQLHVSRLLFHRVEALVNATRFHDLDRWQRALLRVASTRVPCGGELISSFDDLKMDHQVLVQLIRELTEAGLLHRNGSGLWQMTPAGRLALEKGSLAVSREERRTFPFVDNSTLGFPPQFLPLRRPIHSLQSNPPTEPASYSFDIACLQSCIQQTPEWKLRHHFPVDVNTILSPRPDEAPRTNQNRVILDSLEQRLFVLVHTTPSDSDPVLLGFPVLPDGWVLESEPLFSLTHDWEAVLPDLANEATMEQWREAWKIWSQPRGLPAFEVDACRLERVDHRLLVHAPPRLIERLRATRSDAIKQEAWLLAGVGRTRRAAQIELQPL